MNNTKVIRYDKINGITVDMRFDNDDIWLTQSQMAVVFDTSRENIVLHLKNIYETGELIEGATCKKSLQVRFEGQREVKREITEYNLDAIISVGYRINSVKATQFRIWATKQLRKIIIENLTGIRKYSASAIEYRENTEIRLLNNHLDWNADKEKWSWVRTPDILAKCGFPSLDKSQSVRVGMFLHKNLGEQYKKRKARERLWLVPPAKLDIVKWEES